MEDQKQIQDLVQTAAEQAQTKMTPLPAGITAEMISDAKEKHGDDCVKYADLPIKGDENNVLTVLVCAPSRKVLDQFERFNAGQPLKAKEILINSCLLSHKDQVKADDGLFYSCVNAIAELIPIYKATLKNC